MALAKWIAASGDENEYRTAVITADVSAKGGPALYAIEPNSFLFSFFFSILSGILLHEYFQKSS